ncbi:MAG: energy transducer TonB [Bacteroidota bacterium]
MKKLIYSSLFAMLLLGFCAKNTLAQDDQTVYNFVAMETPPSYPGGMANFYKFLGENIKYPKLAKDENIQGNVFVSFTIEKDGAINDVKVEKKLGGGTDEEAVRVLKLSKRWNPGIQHGKTVRVKYNLPIRFAIPGRKPNPKTPTFAEIPGVDNKGENAVYNFVSLDHPPVYPGGIRELYNYMMSNIKYPALAKENKIEGNVFLSFIVEKDGTVSDVKVDKKLGYGTDEEAVRVLLSSPKWKPGSYNEKPVRVKYNIPVHFSLTKSNPKN